MSIHGSNDVQTKQRFAARVAPALHSLRPQRAGVAYALLLLVVVPRHALLEPADLPVARARALGEREIPVLFHDELPPQRNHEEHAQPTPQ